MIVNKGTEGRDTMKSREAGGGRVVKPGKGELKIVRMDEEE